MFARREVDGLVGEGFVVSDVVRRFKIAHQRRRRVRAAERTGAIDFADQAQNRLRDINRVWKAAEQN